MTEPHSVGARLKALRSQKGWIQIELARKLGITNATQISQWENDEYVPAGENLAKLAAIYGVSADWILTGNARRPLSSTTVPRGTLRHRVFNTERWRRVVAAADRVRAWHLSRDGDREPFAAIDAAFSAAAAEFVTNGSGGDPAKPDIARAVNEVKSGLVPEVYAPSANPATAEEDRRSG